MIDIADVMQVQQRIAQIQKRIGLPDSDRVAGDFSSMLQRAVDRQRQSEAAAAAEPTKKETTYHGPEAAAAAKAESAPAAAGGLAAYVQSAAEKYHVDPRLVSAVIQAESGGHQDAVSSAGAIGVMQIMPDTAKALGINPYDMQQNIEGGTHYLREMLDMFGGDVPKALAAYDAGPQAVKNYGGVPPYRETQDYVRKIMKNYR